MQQSNKSLNDLKQFNEVNNSLSEQNAEFI